MYLRSPSHAEKALWAGCHHNSFPPVQHRVPELSPAQSPWCTEWKETKWDREQLERKITWLDVYIEKCVCSVCTHTQMSNIVFIWKVVKNRIYLCVLWPETSLMALYLVHRHVNLRHRWEENALLDQIYKRRKHTNKHTNTCGNICYNIFSAFLVW